MKLLIRSRVASICRSPSPRAFTLVELLAVVMITAVLSAAALPLYTHMRKSSSSRVCRASLKRIAAAQATYYARFGVYCYDGGANGNSKGKGKGKGGGNQPFSVVEEDYTAPSGGSTIPTGGLVGAPAGLASPAYCPLDGAVFTCRRASTDANGVDIQCPNSAAHAAKWSGSSVSDWKLTLLPGVDGLP